MLCMLKADKKSSLSRFSNLQVFTFTCSGFYGCSVHSSQYLHILARKSLKGCLKQV